MRLKNAAKYFDDIPITDAYTDTLLPYKGQFSTFIEQNPDGSTATTRTMSLAPGLALPERGVIKLLGETWMVGQTSQDGIYGESIRQTVPLRRVTDLFTKLTPGQAVVRGPSTTLYGRKQYLKDTTDATQTAAYFPFYELYFSAGEELPRPGTFFRTPKGTLFRSRSAYRTMTEMVCAQCDLVEKSSTTTAEFGSMLYDPILDSYGTGMQVRQVMVMMPHQLHNKTSPDDPTYQPGDLTLLVRIEDGDVKVGQQMQLQTSGIEWADPRWWRGTVPTQILRVTPEFDAWNLHIRRA